ncbi:MAG: NUDIX domain-containing protein [Treponema sp.]|jgi:8-oxo-dGTP diphosphatase|nr:NUDIX domain-containing protein [Treponema sp.]
MPNGISVAGIAFEGGRLFIARRKPGGALGGMWEFPGGKAEEGEGNQEALVREYDEEFSLPIRVGEELANASFEHKGIERSLCAYRIYCNGDFAEALRLNEHEEWNWASLEEIEKLDFVPSDRKILPALKAYLNTHPKI